MSSLGRKEVEDWEREGAIGKGKRRLARRRGDWEGEGDWEG